MKKVKFIFKEMLVLIKERKVLFLSPILLSLSILAALVYYVGPAVIVSFLYAGV